MKRKRKAARDGRAEKRVKLDGIPNAQAAWPLLQRYYTKVVTLRHYLISRLSSSKRRQRRLLHYGTDDHASLTPADPAVVQLLDNIAVGTAEDIEPIDAETIDKDITLFTQQLSKCSPSISLTQGAFKQDEVCSFLP